MAQPSPRDLTPPERTLLALILGARTRQAWLMTALAAFLTAGFVLRVLMRRSPASNDVALAVLFAVVVAVVAALVARFGWGPVRALRADLDEGKATVLEGTVKHLQSIRNAYGETITYADIDDTRVLTRMNLFDGVRAGDRVRALVATRAKVALVVTPLALALLCAGCGMGFFPSPVTPDAPKAAEPGAPRRRFLPIAKLTWTRGAARAVYLTERGELVAHGSFIGTLRADGTFTTRDGTRTLVMEPDGTIHVGPGFAVQIAEDGTATTRVHGQPDETVTLEQVARPRGGQPGLTLEGGSPELRRTAMWALMIPDLLRLQAQSGE